MSNSKNPSDIVASLDEEAKYALLEHLAEEMGYSLSEQVDTQADIVDVLEIAIATLQRELGTLKSQFVEGAEVEYGTLQGAAEAIESTVEELASAHESLSAFIESAFDIEEEIEE